MRVAEELGVGRVRDLAIHGDDVAAHIPEGAQRFAVCRARCDVLAAHFVRGQLPALDLERVWLVRFGLGDVDDDVPDAPELLDRLVGMVERLSVPVELVLDLLDALALERVRDDHGRLTVGVERLLVCAVDLLEVMSLDLDRLPAEGLCPLRVRVEIPAVHRLAALAEPVHVDDRGQVLELVEGGVLERLPHRALGHLAVAAQTPDAVRQLVEVLPGERDPDRDRESLAEGAGGDVDPRDLGGGMAFHTAAEDAEREQLVVRNRAGGLVHGVEEGRGVSLGEDEVVVVRVPGIVEVVVEVLRHEHGHQVGRGHRRGGMARFRHVRGTNRVDPQLLSELSPVVHFGHPCSSRSPLAGA